MDIRPLLLVVGFLLTTLGLAMLIPAVADLAVGHEDWQVFLAASFSTSFIGASLAIANRGASQALNARQAFLLIVMTWVVIALFGSLPFLYADLDLDFADAFFEAMSGVTTTGSTVLTGLDDAPPGILLWRALLQWMGGIGIIVMAVAVLPMLQIGGMQLFRLESSDTSEKILPRAAQISGALMILYGTITLLCIAALWAAGMPLFDAIAHAMTTVATGGFSTSDGSVGHFDSALIESLVILFMIVGSLPFVLYLQLIRGRPLALWRDSQVRWFFAILLSAIAGLTAFRAGFGDVGILTALREVSFNLVSIMTGTGYATEDYNAWGGFAVGVFFLIMFVGGCAGSTSCGVKIFRIQVLFENAQSQVRKLVQPHGIHTPHFNGKPIAPSISDAVMHFFFLFFLCFIGLALCLSAFGLDFITAASAAGTALANVGPGLGEIVGPAGTFQTLPDGAKWFMALGMLLGRLELLGVLILLNPSFWRG